MFITFEGQDWSGKSTQAALLVESLRRDGREVVATREPGGVQQTVVLDELYEEPDRAVALITREWRWDEDGSTAGADEMAWVFELKDHRVRSWRPYDDRAEALRAGRF